MKVFLIILFFSCFILNSVHSHAQIYSVKRISSGLINVNDTGNAAQWSTANVLTDFTYPWDTAATPATSFAALWDGEWLYCLYRVKDDSVLVYQHTNDKHEVGASDRVEIFLKADDKMSPYYCLELDAAGRVLDYAADYYRIMHYDWQWPKSQLKIKAVPTKDGYVVESAISIASLKTLGLLKDNKIQAGLFRAECKSMHNGKSDLRWISWINPKSEQPDFHIPAAFGILELE